MLASLATSITVGDHSATTKLFGMTIDLDVVISTLIAGGIVVGTGLVLRVKATAGVPGRLQLFWETVVEQVRELTDSAIGPQGRRFVPLAVVLFIFILLSNWIEIIPTFHEPPWLVAPTGDINLPLAMALTVFVLIHYWGVRAKGWRGYLGHYAKPFKAFIPINIIEELTKPITLTLRLFGNIFAGGLMVLVLLTLIPKYLTWIPISVWELFDMFIGLIQAFIFALLTVMYLGMSMSTEH